jgi:uncharacterized membrane protein YcaP (DUF421 family)
MWFSGWSSLGRIALFAFASYALLLVLIRTYGQRTIAKMNPSDFVITVAIGSTVAAFILSKDASLADGLVALAVLLTLQLATEWTTTKSVTARKVTEGAPVLLMYRGELLRENMTRTHVNEHEVLAAIRLHGVTNRQDILAVVLEIDGEFSVLTGAAAGDDVLGNVRRHA